MCRLTDGGWNEDGRRVGMGGHAPSTNLSKISPLVFMDEYQISSQSVSEGAGNMEPRVMYRQ